MKTLRDVKVGDTVTVVKLHGEGAVKRRIMDMGITKGVTVTKENTTIVEGHSFHLLGYL